MALITLTSDLGERDHYVASLKGTLHSLCPGVPVIDITHQVSHFNTLEAAFILRSAWPKFPPGTIHLIAVDPEGNPARVALAMEMSGHWFIASDSGVLSLLRDGGDSQCYSITEPTLALNPQGKAFPSQNLYAPVAAWIAKGGKPEEIGTPFVMRDLIWGEPSYSNDSLRGMIIHIDHFGNAITNIRRSEFMKLKGDRRFEIFIRNLKLRRIFSNYSDVIRGEAVALFGDNNHLEIAIREGSAAQLLGLKVHDMLTIEFSHDHADRQDGI
jgi:S-adenosyl-L-methionine hydrolase (adenosine-forming)